MLQAFEDSLAKKGYRTDSIKQIISRLRYLLNHCPFQYEPLDSFLLSKYRSGTTGATLAKYVDVIHAFGAFQGLEWANKIHYYKVEETNRGIFSDEEIEWMISLPCPHRFRKAVWDRWTMWLKILAFSGMRAGEVSSLTLDQVDFGTNNFILTQTKTVPRRVPIAPNIGEDVRQYITGCEKYLFPSPTPRGHVWRQGWHKHFQVRMRLMGLKRPNLTVHSFRHSFITDLLEENVPLPDIMNIVGHRSLESTQKYIHLTNKSAQKAVARHRIVRKSATAELLLKDLIDEAVKRGILDDTRFTWVIDEHSLHIALKEK